MRVIQKPRTDDVLREVKPQLLREYLLNLVHSFRRQDITWANVDPDLCHHMAKCLPENWYIPKSANV